MATSTARTSTEPDVVRPVVIDGRVRRACAVVAVVAWVSLGLVVLLSGLGAFAAGEVTGHLFGHHGSGASAALSRVCDTLSYFTVWSNAVVAIAFTLLAARPDPRSLVQRVLLLDALLMITITTIVYWTLLAAGDTWQGWSVITSPLQHAVVGALAVGTWVFVGPRGILDRDLLPGMLAVPVLWVVWTLGRGAVIDAYPYDFTDVATLGYPAVAVRIGVILLVGLLIAWLYIAADRRRCARRLSA